MTEQPADQAPSPIEQAFARKVRLSTWALVFERLWPRLWLALGLFALFAAISLAGWWPSMPPVLHAALLALFGALGLAALVYAVRIPWPSREEAVRRIERRSGVPHRPATSYEDNLTAYTDSADTKALWQAHRERLARAIGRLRVGTPSPRADRFDPLALRALALLAVVPAAALVTGSFSDRFAAAWRFGKPQAGNETRVDAWVTPPPYTGLPPVMLADGSQAVAPQPAAGLGKEGAELHEIPAKSLLVLRGTGFKGEAIALEVLTAGKSEPTRIVADPPKGKTDVAEVRYELQSPARVRALAGTKELGVWTFDVTPDLPPTITLNKKMDRTPRASMKLSYKAEDDYGVASAVAKVRQAPIKPGDPAKDWAKAPPLKGPRLPLERPPELALKLPRTGAKSVEGATLLELGEHPWAGQKVELWLEATDVAGQVGKSETVEMVLPGRRFTKPLARAVIEQRRKLAEDSRNRPVVARAIDALTVGPSLFPVPDGTYLSLRSVYHRLEREKSRVAMKNAIDQLWYIALKIEDGAVSDAERSLKDVQDRLAKALERGADEKEIQALMDELKQALNNYLQEMQKNAGEDQQQQEGQNEQAQLSPEDLDRLMKDLEEKAKGGSREEAEKALQELRELMDRLQSGNSKEAQENASKAKEALKKLNQMNDLASKQRQLMDDTFKEQRKMDNAAGAKPDAQQRGQKPGQKGQKGDGQQGQQGQEGQEAAGHGDQQRGRDPSGNKGTSDLKDRQSELREGLEKLQRDMDEMGMGDQERMSSAQQAMKDAEDALSKGNLEGATEQQSQALDQMRQSMQQMAEKMAQNSQRRLGRGNSPRDPLDRPQRSEGPDLGNSVKVPDAIDAQRAREILDELRKRSGEALRPPAELDYIDRLLKRF
jgi:uncharacterized protein (TIGR02302 family)